ncbi:MAG: hypothetical protein M3348_00065 [Acidobacteriota bacterium]|nr:hypothetical protein [Acidobacteriota bacterium]
MIALIVIAFVIVHAVTVWALLTVNARAEARATDALDRLFASRNLPPTGTDMRAAHERKERAADERRRTAPKPSDPVARLSNAMAAEEKMSAT